MASPKLPVLTTVRQAYAAILGHSDALGQISRNWLIATAVALLLGYLAFIGPQETERSFDRAAKGAAVITSLAFLVLLMGAYVVIVRWHRMIIRGIAPGETGTRAMSGAFLYFARATLLGMLGLTTALVMSMLPITLCHGIIEGEARRIFAIVVTALAVVLALIVVARLSLNLPATALGDWTVNFRRSWELTRGNTLRLIAGTLLASGPALTMNVVTEIAIRADEAARGNAAVIAAVTVVTLLIAIVAGVIQAGFLSYAYVFFTRQKPMAETVSSVSRVV